MSPLSGQPAEPRTVRLRVAKPVPRSVMVSHIRAIVLFGVYAAITGHVLHWWITGRSLGRFVLSDSMKTLELGEVTPGFLLFCASIIVTMVFGRFLCGWLCHIGALQDLVTAFLRHVGLRPHLFRSRLLGFVPLGLATYMFLWPTFAREAVAPLLKPYIPDIESSLGVRPFPGFSADFTTEHLWDGLPSLWVGIPFLLVCGGAMVFFLGSRGLCRYACPYGGFLLPAEQVAPVRVIADQSKCDQCGLCTAACGMGVRVHDEVRAHGAVLDRNCVRSFDCVAACPHKALGFHAGRPAFAAKHDHTLARSHYDLTWREEFLCLGVFAIAFFTLRGLYDTLPLLMSAPLAIIAAYVAWKLNRLRHDPNVTFARLQLRRASRLTCAGRAFVAVWALAGLLLVQSMMVRLLILRADTHDERVSVSLDAALAGKAVPSNDRAEAGAALRLYSLASPFWKGGIALARTPEAEVRASWMEIVLGQPDRAIDRLEGLFESGRASDQTTVNYADLLTRCDQAPKAIALLRRAISLEPGFFRSRDQLAMLLLRRNLPDEAERVYAARLAARPTDSFARAGMGRIYFLTGRKDEALAMIAKAATDSPREPAIARDLAATYFAMGRVDEAIAAIRTGAKARPAAARDLLSFGAGMLRQVGRIDDAVALEAMIPGGA